MGFGTGIGTGTEGVVGDLKDSCNGQGACYEMGRYGNVGDLWTLAMKSLHATRWEPSAVAVWTTS